MCWRQFWLSLLCWQLQAVEVPPGFVVETLATNLNAASAISAAPDGRVFIADQTGKLLVWKDGAVLERPALAVRVTDYWERGLIGVTLHPDFPRRPHVFVLYVTDRPVVHHVLSRFTMNGDVAEGGSEQVLFEGDDQAKLGGTVPAGHQGGPVRFGSDGKLYVGLGEQTAGEPAQRLNTVQGKILRLNEDGSIPEDNPLLGEGKYRAIFAYGIRNPFGLATQAETKRMFFTDVGGSAFEEVNELMRGANYGWPRAEGFSTNTLFKQPLHAYSPLVGQSIVGGVFLPRGSAWPEKWRGKLFFGDFMKHWIKTLDPEGTTNVVTFARGLNGPVATELAADGSLLVLNRGAIWRDPKRFVANAGSLVRIRYVGKEGPVADAARPSFTAALDLPSEATQLPRTITRSEWENRLRGAKRWPFWLNSSAWQPFAHENIALYLPRGVSAKLAEGNGDIQLPPGAVVVRRFTVFAWRATRRKGDDPSRLIETRLLVIGTPRGYGASYRWKSPERAELVEDGELETFADVASNDDTPRKVSFTWWFPGVDEAPITNPAYWVSTAVEDFIFPPSAIRPNRPVNWLRNMQRAGALETALSPEALDAFPHGSLWQSPLEPAEARVRSYLHGNCAVCHQPGRASRGAFDARITTPLSEAGIINGALAAGDLGIPGAKIVVPGEPEKSILYRRLKATDFFRMPPVQYHNEVSPILPVMEEWIKGMTNVQ